MKKETWLKANYTIEAAIYIPIVMFVLFQSIKIGLDFFQESKERELNEKLVKMDIVQEFYNYQILAEAWEEVKE